MYPDVEATRPDSFRYPRSIYDRSNDVQNRHKRQPAKSRFVDGIMKAVSDNVVHGWYYATETEANKYT